jgi:hypothetical protein
MPNFDDEGRAPGAGGDPGALDASGGNPVQSEAPGSYDADDPDRPQWTLGTKLEAEYNYRHGDDGYAYTLLKGRRPDGSKAFLTGRRVEGGFSELALAKQDDPRGFYNFDGLTNYRKGKGDQPELLYRLPELIREMAERPDDPIFIAEGEKDVETLRALGLIATTNSNGAGKWSPEFNGRFTRRDVVILIDNDQRGDQRGRLLPRSGLGSVVRSLRIVKLPDLRPHGDVTDWLEGGRTVSDFLKVVDETPEGSRSDGNGGGVQLEDFHAFMPSHNYIFAPSGESWPSSSVNSRLRPVQLFDADGRPELDDDGEPKYVPANRWLDEHRPVEQMTWAPGFAKVIADRLISEGGWIDRTGCNVFNLYRPPSRLRGNKDEAGPWLDHVRRVYPDDAEHIINWLAHRVQRPQDKLNHALVLGGAMGIGKDTMLEPVKAAVGAWNFIEVTPQNIMGRFNGFVKSVILRVSEARDLGDVDRFAFYDHMKTYTAAPPDVLRVDEKFRNEYAVFNVCGVIITTNHKTDGLYLPADDRRHFVAWTELTKEDFAVQYWDDLWAWYASGGIGHVAAYLAAKDISGFRAKAPPPKTEAFWDIVAANSAPEEGELNDALAKLFQPEAVTLAMLIAAAEPSFADWLKDRKNSRKVPHKMESCGYRPVRNPNATAGRWKVGGKDMVIYVRKELPTRDAIVAAEKRAAEGNSVPF